MARLTDGVEARITDHHQRYPIRVPDRRHGIAQADDTKPQRILARRESEIVDFDRQDVSAAIQLESCAVDIAPEMDRPSSVRRLDDEIEHDRAAWFPGLLVDLQLHP